MKITLIILAAMTKSVISNSTEARIVKSIVILHSTEARRRASVEMILTQAKFS